MASYQLSPEEQKMMQTILRDFYVYSIPTAVGVPLLAYGALRGVLLATLVSLYTRLTRNK